MNTTMIEGYQLSPQQRRWWLLRQDFQEMPRRVRCTVLLKGNIDVAGLRATFQTVINRHEILRTSFPAISGMDVPLQVISDTTTTWLDGAALPFLQEDCSQQDFEEMLPDIAQQFSDQDVSSPATARLYRLGKTIHVLFLDMPGMWLDYQGIDALVRDLFRYYQPDAASETEEPVQYAALAQWLNELLASEEGAEGRAYWREKITVERAPAPFSRVTRTNGSFRPRRLHTLITQETAERIEKLTGGSHVSWHSFLLAALHTLVWRMTAKEEIVIGSAFDGRTEEELYDVPGLLTRYLPLLAHIEQGSTYAEIWRQVTDAVQEAEVWQDCFDWSAVSRVTGRTDYFPVCFEFYNERKEYSAGDISGTIIDSLVYNDPFDIRLVCRRTKKGLVADFYYNREILSDADAERLAAYFAKLVEAAVTNVDADIASLPILGEAERQVLLNDFALGRRDTFVHGCLPYAFEEQVQRTPHRTALICEGHKLTYAELNTRANRLAHRLKRSGVKPETMVAYCTERSTDTIVSLLGILKAGGVCVPLESTYPAERLAFILKDSQSTVIVTQEKLAHLFDEYRLELVSLDTLNMPEIEAENPVHEIEPEHLAYVIYTSGSTGLPKGVGVSHYAALNHFMVMHHTFQLHEDDRILEFASLSFDVSLEQIFPGLLCGAAIVMRGSKLWGAEELNRAIAEQRLTVVNLTPAFWQQWTRDMQREASELFSVRLVIVGGEAMTLKGLHSWLATPLATRRLLNAYGPTETVITAATCDVSTQIAEEDNFKTAPIGRPLANREIYILDSHGELAARGVAGELYIGGELLARGYLNRPDLTAERFVPHPLSTTSGARLYRSGDLGRYLPDGNIEYLDRIDQQVKIRGFRIELGEIEAILQKHPAVQSAIVVTREDNSGEKRLIAYVLPYGKCRTKSTDLRAFLNERLPEYMVPTTIIFLDTIPLTPNGKVDRRALPAPETAHSDQKEVFVAPRTPMEQTLASIWHEILELDQVGIHDNFFALGGHSLVAIQVITRVRTAFQVELPVHALFQESTIARLASKIIEAQEMNNGPALPTITRLSRDGETAVRGQTVSE